jgi:hypothetical protein
MNAPTERKSAPCAEHHYGPAKCVRIRICCVLGEMLVPHGSPYRPWRMFREYLLTGAKGSKDPDQSTCDVLREVWNVRSIGLSVMT